MSDIAAATQASAATSQSSPKHGATLWSHGSFGFKDFLDIINPLQHLPVIGSIYRYLTGDEPSGGARIVGDAIYGGPIGFGAGVVSTMLTDDDGRDVGERALAWAFGPRDGGSTSATAVAQAPTTAPLPAASPPQAQTVPPALVATQAGQAQPGGPAQLATQLYRSPPAAVAPAAPEQNFLAQNAQLQRQLSGTRPETGQVLNNRPVPLQLTGSPLPNIRQTPAIPSRPVTAPPAAASSPVAATADNASVTNPIALKMLDALDKYERLKKKQEQGDSANDNIPSGVDLTL
jgi:hypothetical protein